MSPMTIVIILVLLITGAGVLIWRLRHRTRADDRFHEAIPNTIRLESGAFDDQGAIPVRFTCRGESASPPLHWSNLPEGSRSLALLMTDEDLPAPGLRLFKIDHWVIYDIPLEVDHLTADAATAQLHEQGIVVGRNWSRDRAYAPPCPPFGRHRYRWRLYALDVEALEPVQDTRRGVLEAMQGHILACGTLTGFYGR